MKALLISLWIGLSYTGIFAQAVEKDFYITNNNDTVNCTFPRQSEKVNYFHRMEVVLDTGSVILLPSDVKVVLKDGVVYRSFKLKSTGTNPVSFFLKEITSGKAELYYYNGGILHDDATYFFRKRGASTFFTFSKERTVKSADFQNEARRGTTNILYLESDEKFRGYFFTYFQDCPMLARKIKLEYYDRDDTEKIFTEYNTCK